MMRSSDLILGMIACMISFFFGQAFPDMTCACQSRHVPTKTITVVLVNNIMLRGVAYNDIYIEIDIIYFSAIVM